eukprot:gene15100-biopygen1248
MRWILALQEYKFTLVHKPGALNPADLPSREPVSCMADATGARLDEGLFNWPLPKVLHADLTPDDTMYTHEGLTEELGIAVSQRPAAAVVQQCSCLPVHALAEEQGRPVLASQLQYEVLTSILDSNDDMLVSPCPTSASLLGGEDVCGALQGTYNVKQQQDKAIAWRAQELHRAATAWVTLGSQQLKHDRPAPTLPGKCSGPADKHGVKLTTQLCTAPCGSSFFTAACAVGMVVWEP